MFNGKLRTRVSQLEVALHESKVRIAQLEANSFLYEADIFKWLGSWAPHGSRQHHLNRIVQLILDHLHLCIHTQLGQEPLVILQPVKPAEQPSPSPKKKVAK